MGMELLCSFPGFKHFETLLKTESSTRGLIEGQAALAEKLWGVLGVAAGAGGGCSSQPSLPPGQGRVMG